MQQAIKNKLNEIEYTQHVRILYSCESGSRAWGFPSPDSDFDVCFIYVHSLYNYLSIKERADTIDLPVDALLDIGGWELRKTLQLLKKSNAVIYEWLQSPIVYMEDSLFVAELKSLMKKYFSQRTGVMHYLGIAKNAWNDLQDNEIKIKKYFYCLRPVLAALWIIEKNEAPPMEFSTLRNSIENTYFQDSIDELLSLKSQSNEKTLIKLVPVLHKFLEEKMQFCAENLPGSNELPDYEELNGLFRKQVHDF